MVTANDKVTLVFSQTCIIYIHLYKSAATALVFIFSLPF